MIPKKSKEFLPFHKIKGKEVVIVDALHPDHFVLSHWKGANLHPELAADSSGEIALNAIVKNISELDTPYVSATHFDIDGFVGVFALVYPEIAKEHDAVLREMARIGDFREFKPSNEDSRTAMKLCCWMNKVEKEKFYRPFEEKDEMESCIPKFDYFLDAFPSVLKDLAAHQNDWREEFERVEKDLSAIQKQAQIIGLGLQIVEAEKPLHYYALFSNSSGMDIVLSIYPEQRYELELKYTTWIDLASRTNLPRIDLRPLAKTLNQIENSDYSWKVDKITDTGPILRLEEDKLSKADRYAHPFERNIYTSSIPKEEFMELVSSYLKQAYKEIKPKRFWTWKEMKALSN